MPTDQSLTTSQPGGSPPPAGADTITGSPVNAPSGNESTGTSDDGERYFNSDWLNNQISPFVQAAERQRRSVAPEGGRAEGAVTGLMEKIGQKAANVVQNTMTLPQRAMAASERLRTTGQYDPAPAVETALMTAGPGGAALARRAGGRAVAGDTVNAGMLGQGVGDAVNEHDLSTLISTGGAMAVPYAGPAVRAAGRAITARPGATMAAGAAGGALAAGEASGGAVPQPDQAAMRRQMEEASAISTAVPRAGQSDSMLQRAGVKGPQAPDEQPLPNSMTRIGPQPSGPQSINDLLPPGEEPPRPYPTNAPQPGRFRGDAARLAGPVPTPDSRPAAPPAPKPPPGMDARELKRWNSEQNRAAAERGKAEAEIERQRREDQARIEADAAERKAKLEAAQEEKRIRREQEAAKAEDERKAALQKAEDDRKAAEEKRVREMGFRERHPVISSAMQFGGIPAIAALTQAGRYADLLSKNSRVRDMLSRVGEMRRDMPALKAAGDKAKGAGMETELKEMLKAKPVEHGSVVGQPSRGKALASGATTAEFNVLPEEIDLVNLPPEAKARQDADAVSWLEKAGLGAVGGATGYALGEKIPVFGKRLETPTAAIKGTEKEVKTFLKDAPKKAEKKTDPLADLETTLAKHQANKATVAAAAPAPKRSKAKAAERDEERAKELKKQRDRKDKEPPAALEM